MQDGKLGLGDLAVGQRFTSGPQAITAEEIKRFAAAYDPQPFHLDEAAAQTTFFAGLAASGWHTAAITMRLIVESLPLAGGVIGGGGEIVWPKPVRPGDILRVESEILAITPSRTRPGRANLLVRCLTRNQHGETVQSFTPKVVMAGPA